MAAQLDVARELDELAHRIEGIGEVLMVLVDVHADTKDRCVGHESFELTKCARELRALVDRVYDLQRAKEGCVRLNLVHAKTK
jgi:hypothetical protein